MDKYYIVKNNNGDCSITIKVYSNEDEILKRDVFCEAFIGNDLYIKLDPLPKETPLEEISKDDYFLELARQYSKKAHSGQVDKAGVDYFEGHITSVVNGVNSKEAKTVAYLHDTIEDTKVTKEQIEFYFPKEISEAVILLTKDRKEDYFKYLKRIKLNSLAREVKISDLKHNSDLRRINNPTQKDIDRTNQYLRAIRFLED